MTIQTGDVKLLKSAVMSDAPEGGGAPTGEAIPDGVSNAIFPDISQLDRAIGRVSLRKVTLGVRTDDTATYFGANVIVADPPKDPRVSVTLFRTGQAFDTRKEAITRVEAYLNKGPEWPGFLYEGHIAGQRVIQIYQREAEALPSVGQTLVIVQNEGAANQIEQYVRATRVNAVVRTFTDSNGADYKAAIVTVELSDKLRTDFIGSSASRFFMRAPNAARIRDTVVADAGSYVSVSPLARSAALGDFTVVAKAIFTQLVPSAQTETPIPGGIPYAVAGLPAAGAEEVTFATTQAWDNNTTLALPGGCLPGSLKIRVGAGAQFTDVAGILMSGTQQVGTVDYANGIVASSSGNYAGTKTISYRPAAYMQRMPQSSEIRITPETRSQSFAGFITPLAARGTLSFSYRAQGRWYVLSDAGDGSLRGIDSSYGAGTYNADTGSYVITLGALPDVGSSIIIGWGVPTQETVHAPLDMLISQTIALQLPAGQALYPGAFSIAWMDGATQRTATANAAWQLQGDATGEVRVGRSEVLFAPKLLPAIGTVLDVTVDTAPANEVTLAHPSRNGQGRLAVAAGVGGLVPYTVEVEWNTLTDLAVLGTYTRAQLQEMGINPADPTQIARDDGAGKLMLGSLQVGTLDYAAGTVDFNPDVTIKIPKPHYSAFVASGSNTFLGDSRQWRLNYEGIEYVNAPSTYPNDESGYVKIRFRTTGSATRHTMQVQFAPEFALVTGVQAPVVPGSVVMLPASGQPWSDDGRGTLRVLTAAGFVTRGTVNYATGRIALTSWTPGNANSVRRASCITTLGDAISSAFVFRTASSPLRPGSLTVQVPRASGGVQNVTAGIDGTISAPGVVGTVDYETGLVRLGFGSLVNAAASAGEPWYDPANVQPDGKIFKPAPVVASALRYSAVAYSYLPLDADLLGIDPVRLPSDGRVPIFRPGGVAVVGHTGSITATFANDQTVDCGRVRLSRVRVVGADGKVIHGGYTANLEAGIVHIADVATWAQPATIEHRIEDMAVVRDVQISGEISFASPLSHDYPVGSYVASALTAGSGVASDLFARVNTVFDQQTWVPTWADVPQGADALASFNAAQYPIKVTNRGAITQRWALRFTSPIAFDVIGENVGVIAVGNTSEDCKPINPAEGVPYFVLPWQGWGNNWAVGNVLRFNTVEAGMPFWVARTVQPGPETVPDDTFTLLGRGDVDNPKP